MTFERLSSSSAVFCCVVLSTEPCRLLVRSRTHIYCRIDGLWWRLYKTREKSRDSFFVSSRRIQINYKIFWSVSPSTPSTTEKSAVWMCAQQSWSHRGVEFLSCNILSFADEREIKMWFFLRVATAIDSGSGFLAQTLTYFEWENLFHLLFSRLINKYFHYLMPVNILLSLCDAVSPRWQSSSFGSHKSDEWIFPHFYKTKTSHLLIFSLVVFR